MSYLLDTHTLLWLIEVTSKVSVKIKDELKFSGNATYLSSVSLWELRHYRHCHGFTKTHSTE